MSYAFYPADLLLPPLTSYRTAASMLLLLLAGIITLCYVRKVLRDSARLPDPMSHPIYGVGGPVVVPPFDMNIAVQMLEAHVVAGPSIPALQKATKALIRVRVSITGAILPDPVFDRAVIREVLSGGVFVGTDRRSALNPAC